MKKQKNQDDFLAPTGGSSPGTSGDAFSRYQDSCGKEFNDSISDWQEHWKGKQDLLDLMRPGGMVIDFKNPKEK